MINKSQISYLKTFKNFFVVFLLMSPPLLGV